MKKVNVGDTIEITRYDDKDVSTIAEVLELKDTPGKFYAKWISGDSLDTYSGGRLYIELRYGDKYTVIEETPQADSVNSPQHYTNGRFETIEIIEEITKGYDNGYVGMCVGNALKYLARAPYKHDEPTEDLRKAEHYIAFAIEHLTKEGE